MIGWLQGERVEHWSQGGRQGLVIACAGVGYEVQLASRHLQALCAEPRCTLWIHQVYRDDGSSLFGFTERRERDLFRVLIGVNGVGPQVGLALLDCCSVMELIQAIMDGDLTRLTQAQGVGKRTAERLVVELRDRLGSWSATTDQDGSSLSLVDRSDLQSLPIQCDPLQELQLTLGALGYEDLEIRRAMRAVATGDDVPAADDGDGWLRASLRWLNRPSA